MRQQPAFYVQRITPALMHEAAHARPAHHAMAGNDHGNGIGTAGLTDRARAGIELLRQLTIMPRLAAWNSTHCLPNFSLMCRAIQLER